MKRLNVLILTLSAIILSACAQSSGGDAGMTRFEVKTVQLDANGKATRECTARLDDGKDREQLEVIGEVCGGIIMVSAKSSIGSKGQAIEAAVAKTLNEMAGKTIPEIASAVTRAVLGVTALGGASDAAAAKGALDAAKLKLDAARMARPQ